MMEWLFIGLGGEEAVMTAVRVMTGLFFALSGWHKLFNAQRHAALVSTLKADCGEKGLWWLQWVIPIAELAGGLALIGGFLTVLASLGLMVIVFGAVILDGLKRVDEMRPLNKADWVDCCLYLPETLYLLILLLLVAVGGGQWSIDAIIGGVK